MKKFHRFLIIVALIAPGEIMLAADLQSQSMQYGQGGSITFFKPIETKTADVKASTAVRSKNDVRWVQRSIPNGGTVSYTVRENSRAIEIAPVK
jgi:hypothetical protein